LCAAEVWKLQPQNEYRLECKVPREVVENHSECNALQEVEEPENDPISEPLNIILMTGAFQGLEGEVAWKGPSNEVRNRCGERVDKVEKGEEKNSADDKVGLWNLSSLLKCVQYWILREFFVKLLKVIVRLVLRLDKSRVLLKLLCCRHLKGA